MNLFLAWFVALVGVGIRVARFVFSRLDAKAMRRWRRDEVRRQDDALGESSTSHQNPGDSGTTSTRPAQ